MKQPLPQLDLFSAPPKPAMAAPSRAAPAVAALPAPKRVSSAVPFDPRTASLASAKLYLQAKLEQGTVCPCCSQYAKVYRRKINSGMAVALMVILRRTKRMMPYEGWLHIPDDFKDSGELVGVLKNRDYPKLRYWGLLEAFEGANLDSDTPCSGKWRLTNKGVAFCMGEVRVPKYVFIYNGIALARAQVETVGIKDALGEKFSYEELMRG